jgi:hypothetical protein
MFNKSIEVIKKLKDQQDLENQDIWTGSKFEAMNDLKIDYSGKVGENVFFPFLMENTDWNVVYLDNSNTNAGDGVYDGMINGKRVEVKTARLGKSTSKYDMFGGNFQHENLKHGECDYVLFLDYTPNYMLMTVVDFQNINLDESHSVLGIKPHKRKDTTNIYKLDLKENTSIKKAVDGGIAMKVDENTNDVEIIEFLLNFFPKTV